MNSIRRLVIGLLLTQILPVASASADEYRGPLFRHRTVQAAWETAIAKRKPLLVMFTTDGCAYCTKMFGETYSNPAVERFLLSQTETVIAHTRDNAALAKKLGIRGFPTSLLVAPSGDVLQVAPGFVEPREFLTKFGGAVAKHASAAQADTLAADR